jgi:hypothetical protein
MTTYDGPRGRIVITPRAREETLGEALLDWAAARPALSLGIGLGLGLLASLLIADDRKARSRGSLFRVSRFAAAGLVGQATSFLTRFAKRLVFG